MAAPICTFCGRIQRNLQRVTGTKRAYEKDIEKILTDALCLQISFTFACKICVPCLTLCEKFCEFKRKVKGNTELLNSLAISPALMSPSTPKGPTPKRRRMNTPLKSIAEVKPTEKKISSRRSIDFDHDHGYSLQTEESVGETLAKKIHSNSTPRKSVAEKIHSNLTPRKSVAEWLKETCNPGFSLQNEESVGETLAKKIHSNSTPRKSVAEKIHGNLTPRKSVAEWLKETLSKVDESNEEQKVKKEIIIHHLAALQKLAFNGASVLFKKSPSVLCDSTLSEIVDEMKNHLPFLYSLLNVMIGVSGSKTGTIALIYAMILHSRNKQASRMQRIMSTFLMSCNASNMLMTRLNKFHLTLSGDSKVNLIKDYANYNEHLVIKAVAAGEDGKLNGDNLDIFVTTNDIRMTNHNKDYHFFATDWTPYRVKQQDFNEHAGVQEAIDRTIDLEPTTENFLVSDNENKKFVHYLAQLLGREMSKTCTNFKWLESVVPKHIEHSLSDIMSRKTVSYRLPILLKNEAKYDDCIQIMESYVTMVTDWYNKAGRGAELTNLKVPVGGDQLTRVRLQGAKSLRAGCHTARERLDILFPVVVELFHTVMDFLEKMIKKFMKKNGRDIGALQNLKVLIQRSSVNGNVKSRYAAHEDFSMLVGRSYFLEYALSYFGMNSLDDIPRKHIPENIKNCHQAKKESIFQTNFNDLATGILGKCKFEPPSKSIFVNGVETSIPLAADKIVLNLNSSGGIVQVPIEVKSLANPLLLKFPNGTSINIKSKGDDDLFNYAKHYLHYFSILLCIKDAIREGNIFIINIALKMMLPCFFAHSELSKYFVECIHFILLTEHLLEPRLALQVRISSLVNPNGGPGANKPADMEKENQVRDLKKLIKGLGANKTENSIINLSKAAPIVDSITENIDVQITCKSLNTCHKSRPDIPDLETLLAHIHQLQPFQYTEGRSLNSFKFFKASVYDELYDKKDRFIKFIDSVVWRSKMNFNVPVEDESGSSDEEQ